MAATLKLIVKDVHWKDVEELLKVKSAYTKVGYPTEKEPDPGNKKTMADISEIAAFNEYGTKRIPARPFMSTSFADNLEKINQLMLQVYDRLLVGTMTVRQGLGLVGEFTTDRIKAKIREITSPPNTPSTIERKKRKRGTFLAGKEATKVLIDTGQMINSTTHVEVVE